MSYISICIYILIIYPCKYGYTHIHTHLYTCANEIYKYIIQISIYGHIEYLYNIL